MLGKNILIASLSMSTIALYSCGGKKNNTTTAAKKESQTKLIETNFNLVVNNEWQAKNNVFISGNIQCTSETTARDIELNINNSKIVAIANEECNIKINKITNASESDETIKTWTAQTGKELKLALKANGSIDFTKQFGEFTNSGKTMYLNGNKKANGALNFFFKADNLLIKMTSNSQETADDSLIKTVVFETAETVSQMSNDYSAEFKYDIKRKYATDKLYGASNFQLKINGLVEGSSCLIALKSSSTALTTETFKEMFNNINGQNIFKKCPTAYETNPNAEYAVQIMRSNDSNTVETFIIAPIVAPTTSTNKEAIDKEIETKDNQRKALTEQITKDTNDKILLLNIESLNTAFEEAYNNLGAGTIKTALDLLNTNLASETTVAGKLKVLSAFTADNDVDADAKEMRENLTNAQIQEATFLLDKENLIKNINAIYAL